MILDVHRSLLENLSEDTIIGSSCGNSFVIKRYNNDLSYEQNKVYFAQLIKKYKVDSALVIDKSLIANYRLRVFEKDETESNACGNGALLTWYLTNEESGLIETKQGIQRLNRTKDSIYLEDTTGIVFERDNMFFTKVGEPHIIVLEKKDKSQKDAFIKKITAQYGGDFNINFLEKTNDLEYNILTYERGVNSFTLSCGTGCLSSFMVLLSLYPKLKKDKTIRFSSRGGLHFVNMTDVLTIRLGTNIDNIQYKYEK